MSLSDWVVSDIVPVIATVTCHAFAEFASFEDRDGVVSHVWEWRRANADSEDD
jgi:hypothetical protein